MSIDAPPPVVVTEKVFKLYSHQHITEQGFCVCEFEEFRWPCWAAQVLPAHDGDPCVLKIIIRVPAPMEP